MINTKEFVKELIRFGVEWCEESHNHWIGMQILSNKDMKVMCSNKYGREYDLLTNREKKKIRNIIFNKIKYGIDYEE